MTYNVFGGTLNPAQSNPAAVRSASMYGAVSHNSWAMALQITYLDGHGTSRSTVWHVQGISSTVEVMCMYWMPLDVHRDDVNAKHQ